MGSKQQTNTTNTTSNTYQGDKSKPISSGVSLGGTPKGQGHQSVQGGSSVSSSRAMSIAISSDNQGDIDKVDKMLVQELNVQKDEIEFEYTSPEEIRSLLNRFLKSNFTTDKLTTFIKEVCLEYSELLFFAYKSINDIKEIEAVKNALNERYRRYHKLSNVLESELAEFKKFNTQSSMENNEAKSQGDSKSKQEFETKFYAAMNEVNRLRELCETNQKKVELTKQREELVLAEYESFKVIFMKEIRNVKYDLEETISERNNLRDALIEFKNYFNQVTNSQQQGNK